MMKNIIKIVVGILMMGAGLFNATLKIDNTWHYFSNGVVFGIGLALFITTLATLWKKKKKSK